MNQGYIAIGLDIGHSGSKITFALDTDRKNHSNILVPTYVTPAFKLSSPETARRAKTETVELNGKQYFYGNTADRQGALKAFSGQEETWYFTETHDVLVLAGMNEIEKELAKKGKQIPDNVVIFIGLPASRFGIDAGALKERVEKLVRTRLRPEQNLEVRVKSQAETPLYMMFFSQNGEIDKGYDMINKELGAVEIGHFTTDVTMIINGDIREQATGSLVGVNQIYEKVGRGLAEMGLSNLPRMVNDAIHKGEVKHNGKLIDVNDLVKKARIDFAETLVMEVGRLLGDQAAALDGIALGGGGAPLVYDVMNQKFPHTVMFENPRFCVAEAFCRSALFVGKDVFGKAV